MDDLKLITASNIINLRTAAKMTQAELAERLNYSDKSVSKWERAEAVPDAYILKAMSEIFDVSVDYLLAPHNEWKKDREKRTPMGSSKKAIIGIILASIFLIALMAFVILWIIGYVIWIILIYGLVVGLVALLVLHSIWEHGRCNYLIIAGLVAAIFLGIVLSAYAFGDKSWWQLLLLIIPAELVVLCCSRLKPRWKKH